MAVEPREAGESDKGQQEGLSLLSPCRFKCVVLKINSMMFDLMMGKQLKFHDIYHNISKSRHLLNNGCAKKCFWCVLVMAR